MDDIFRPPPAVRQTTPVRHLDSSQDLLGRFGLIPAYDVYVRPFVRPSHSSLAKGKAKEVDLVEMPDGNSNRIPHGLKSFLSDLPGKTSTKKSEPISDLMLAPPKQRVEILQFDTRTLENFRLPEGQTPFRPNQQLQGTDETRKKKKRPRDEDGGGVPAPSV